MDDDLTTARAANPYTGKEAYNPEGDLGIAELAYEEYKTSANELAPSTDFAADVAVVEAEYLTAPTVTAPEDVDVDADVSQAANAYEIEITPELMRSIGRFAASRQEAGAVGGTGFTFGLAELERAHLEKIGSFRGKLHSELTKDAFQFKLSRDLKKMELEVSIGVEDNKQRYAWLVAASELLSKMRLAKLSAIETSGRIGMEIGKLGIVARKEQHDMNIALATKASTYNLDLYAYGGNLLASVSGGVYKTAGEMESWEKWLSGASSVAGIIGDIWGTTKK
jgi:hypothetical protein